MCVITGDNLSSHLSEEVINLCGENDIEFVCFPPNSTHKLQPLDVGFFGPMKKAWRRIIMEKSDKNPDFRPLDKTKFPRVLKQLLDSLRPEELLPSAFAAYTHWTRTGC